MPFGSSLSSFLGGLVGQVAPQTGPALGTVVNTTTSGNLAGLGHALDGTIDAAGSDTTTSTVLHGVASTVSHLSDTGISDVLAPVATAIVAPLTKALAAATETPLGLLAPHFSPATSTLLTSVGSGNVDAIGQAVHGVINAAGADIAQSTILHGVAGAVTTAFDSFHFAPSNGAGTDALSGIASTFAAASSHVADASSTLSAAHADISHMDVPIAHDPLGDLAHAVHHA